MNRTLSRDLAAVSVVAACGKKEPAPQQAAPGMGHIREGEELYVYDVAHVLSTHISTASHPLRKLRDLRLLRYRNDGKMTLYSLNNRLAGKLVREALDQATGAQRFFLAATF